MKTYRDIHYKDHVIKRHMLDGCFCATVYKAGKGNQGKGDELAQFSGTKLEGVDAQASSHVDKLDAEAKTTASQATVTINAGLLRKLLEEYEGAANYSGEGCWTEDIELVKQVKLAMFDSASSKSAKSTDATQVLISQALDAVGVMSEYTTMPCKSLSDKFPTTCVRLSAAAHAARSTLNA